LAVRGKGKRKTEAERLKLVEVREGGSGSRGNVTIGTKYSGSRN